MKILLISESEELKSRIEKLLASTGAEIINYRHPIKAMDNLEELSPEAVLFSATDFPRHWKIFLVFLRSFVSRESVPFILIKGNEFDYDEASKATFLGVNGVVADSLEPDEEMQKMKDILARYKKIEEPKRTSVLQVYKPAPEDRVDLIFLHPDNLHFIRGKVTALSPSELHFFPSDADKTVTLEKNTVISDCSLRIGQKICQVDLELTSISDDLVFRFLQPVQEISALISSYPS